MADAEFNPIFSDNRLKLGTFCNNSAMPQMSRARERYNPTWERSKAIANRVNAMGLEAILSLATWRGPIWGNAQHCSNQEFEPFTWAAALSALSTHAAVIPTFHVKLMKPAFVAKAVATIDPISGGRAAVNIVAGNTEIAYAQFGETMEDPIARFICHSLIGAADPSAKQFHQFKADCGVAFQQWDDVATL